MALHIKLKVTKLGIFAALTSLMPLSGFAADLPQVETLTSQPPHWVVANKQQQKPNQNVAGRQGVKNAVNQAIDPVESQAYQAEQTLQLLQKLEYLQQEVQELRGKVEEQSHQMNQMTKRQKDLYLDIDRRLREGAAQPVGGVSSMSLRDREATKSVAKGEVDSRISSQYAKVDILENLENLEIEPSDAEIAAEEQSYNKAFKMIQNKDYDGALMSLKSVAKSFPQGKYLPNVHYWLGEIYLVKGQLALAQEEFDTVFSRFPDHQKAADALLKLGYVEYAKGEWTKSKSLLDQVKTRFPGTTSARLADARLERMKQEGNL